MDYDKDLVIGEQNILSNIRLNSSIESNNILVYTDLLLNLPTGFTYDLSLSRFNIIFQDTTNQPILSRIGSLEEPETDDGYLKTKMVQISPITIPYGTYQISIIGRVYLSNGKYFIVNRILSPTENQEIFINTHFSNL
jgi:hypothetical protein